MKRTDFIRTVSLLAAGFACPSARTWGRFAPAETALWPELVDYARWCPSPHNVQPWKLAIRSATEAHLLYDPARVPGVVDADTAFTIAAMSMFVECLRIAAQSRGFTVVAASALESQLSTRPGAPRLFAALHLEPFSGTPVYDRDLILARRTSRLHYNGQTLPPPVVRRLEEVAAADGHELIVSTDVAVVNDLVHLNTDTILQRSGEEATMTEMRQWVRATEAEAAAAKDGLWSRANAVSPRTMHNFFFRHHRFEQGWKRAATRRLLNQSMNGTACLAWIKGPFGQRSEWEAAGSMLQRLWLATTRENIFLHPIGTIITTPGAKAAVLQRTGEGEQAGPVWFLMRMGYSRTPARSFRLTASDIILAES